MGLGLPGRIGAKMLPALGGADWDRVWSYPALVGFGCNDLRNSSRARIRAAAGVIENGDMIDLSMPTGAVVGILDYLNDRMTDQIAANFFYMSNQDIDDKT